MQKSKHIFQIIFVVAILATVSISFSRSAHAATNTYQYQPLATIPLGTTGQSLTTAGQNLNPVTYIENLYVFAFSVGIVIAVVSGVWAGVQWMTGGDSPSKIASAKSRLQNVGWGFALLLCSYVILDLINPQLVNFNLNLGTVGTGNLQGDLQTQQQAVKDLQAQVTAQQQNAANAAANLNTQNQNLTTQLAAQQKSGDATGAAATQTQINQNNALIAINQAVATNQIFTGGTAAILNGDFDSYMAPTLNAITAAGTQFQQANPSALPTAVQEAEVTAYANAYANQLANAVGQTMNTYLGAKPTDSDTATAYASNVNYAVNTQIPQIENKLATTLNTQITNLQNAGDTTDAKALQTTLTTIQNKINTMANTAAQNYGVTVTASPQS